jgi:hypothetical protein
MELKSNEAIDDLFYALRIQDEDRKEVVRE